MIVRCKRMNYVEYGKENSNVIILLHGGGLSWWNYRAVAKMLQYEYRVILPILDGHAASDRDFTTIEDNAAEVIEFINEQFGGSVLLLGGLSLGVRFCLKSYLSVRIFVSSHSLRVRLSYRQNSCIL